MEMGERRKWGRRFCLHDGIYRSDEVWLVSELGMESVVTVSRRLLVVAVTEGRA